MKKLVAVASVALLLSGCGDTTEQVCRKIDQQLKKDSGKGLADVGWIGCLKQSPGEAKLTLAAIEKQSPKGTRVAETKLMSRDDVAQLVATQPPFDVAYKLGAPDSAYFYPFDIDGKFISESTTIGGITTKGPIHISYSADAKFSLEMRNPKIWEDIHGKLAIYKDGLYRISYERPMTYWLLGLQDEHLKISFVIKNGKVIERSADFPKHFWQKWFN